jgi:cell division protein FtsL
LQYQNKHSTTMSYQPTTYYNTRRQQNWSRNQNTARFSSAVKLGPVAHTVLVVLMVTVLGLIYLTQATRTTSYDYQSQAIESQIANLSTTKSDLEVENARLTSLNNVKNSNVAKAMTTPSNVQYVQQ